jgi:Phytanoyl-CoA dioxygenase (PhyH)/Phosphotransferase enzyme family
VSGGETVLARVRYRERGYCVSPPLLDGDAITSARVAAGNVIAGRYETGVKPLYRNLSQGDPPRSLLKIDLPHLCDRALQRVVSDERIGAWVADLLDVGLVQMWACELICKFPKTPLRSAEQGVIGWHQDDHSFRHWVGQICTVWLALVDVDERMGPVRYVERSHRWGRRDAARFFFQADLDEQRASIGTPAGREWREVTAALAAGAVSAHHRLTLHASGPNLGEKPRLGIAIHLRTENAHLVTTKESSFHRPDLSDTYACPVLTDRRRARRAREMMDMDPYTEEQLTGGFLTGSVTRSGNLVRRTAGAWSPAVHAWLAHLANAGVDLAPRPVSLNSSAGTEELTYIGGVVLSGGASPSFLWRDETLTAIAQLIQRFHDAAASFTRPADAKWQRTAAYPGGGEVICHNDLAPWNTVFTDERPAAFIDWDLAAPGPRWWDASYAIWHFVPLYGDPSSDPFDLADFEPRARRTRLFCDAYGMEHRGDLVDRILERQRAVYTSIEHGAQAGDPAYQRLWELGAGAGIQRQIGYVQANRSALEDALK